jgi:hypothetical protein
VNRNFFQKAAKAESVSGIVAGHTNGGLRAEAEVDAPELLPSESGSGAGTFGRLTIEDHKK